MKRTFEKLDAFMSSDTMVRS